MNIPQDEITNKSTLRGKIVAEHFATLSELFDSVEKKRKSLPELLQKAMFVTSVVEETLKGFETHVRVVQYAAVYPGDIHVKVNGLTSWTTLETLFNRLESLFPLDKWESSSQPEDYSRAYVNRIGIGGIELRVIGTLVGDTDECRRVIVGWTKPEIASPEPIYEFDCNPDTLVGLPKGTGIPTPDKLENDIPF